MAFISIYRAYRIHYTRLSSRCAQWSAYRPGSKYGEPFDLAATSFDEIREEIRVDEAVEALAREEDE